MKKNILFTAASLGLLSTVGIYAQGVSVNSSGNAPDPSAMIDVNSTTKGALIPRMTTAQRDSIAEPATGLQIYNLDCKNFNYYDGTGWVALNTNSASIPPQPGNITGNTNVCAGSTGNIYSIAPFPGAVSYLWTVPAGSVITSGQGTTSITVTLGNASGAISVTENNACGTSSPSALAITAGGPSANINSHSTAVCSGNATTIFGSLNASGAWTLTLSDGSSTNGSGNAYWSVNVSPSSTTIYTISSLNDQSGCSSGALTGADTVTVNANPVPAFTGGTAGCVSMVVGTVANYISYSWADNSSNTGNATTFTEAVLGTDNIYVTVTDGNGCVGSNSEQVTITNPSPPTFTGAAAGCAPNNVGTSQSYASYSWIDNSSNTGNASTFAESVPGTDNISVTVTDGNGCPASASETITVYADPTVSAGGNISVQACGGGGSAQIGGNPTASGGQPSYNYSWSPSTGLSSTSVANPVANPSSTTSYTVTVTDANSCSSSSSMTFAIGTGSMTFNYTGAQATWTVPAGVTCVHVIADGATGQAGSGSGGNGGNGGEVKADLTVTPGSTLYIYVGSSDNGFNGGGGGGGGDGGTYPTNGVAGGGQGGDASDIRQGGNALSDRVIVAGGGGGGGGGGWNGSQAGSAYNGGSGGYGGNTATNGNNGRASNNGPGFGGNAGSQGNGGSAGNSSCTFCNNCPTSTNGSQSSGGSGGFPGGGGGGGGYYGGGGGGNGCYSGAGGGGGGSSYAGAGTSNTTFNDGTWSGGNGQVIFIW